MSGAASAAPRPHQLALAYRALRRAGLYYFLVVLRAAILAVPEALAHAVFRFLADLAFITVGIHRRRAFEHLRVAFPEMPPWRVRLTAKRMARHLARSAVEFVRFSTFSKERIRGMITIEGRDVMEQVTRDGRGVIAMSAHLGNWELFAAAMSAIGLKITVVARRIYYEKFDSLVRGMRRHAGVSVVYRDQPKEILRCLRQGHILGVLPDMDVEKLENVYVDFFGRLALTPVGPVVLALRTGLPLVPAFIVRNEQGGHTIMVEPPIRLVRTGDTRRDVLVNTIRATKIIERVIRRFPDQWAWMHRRWQHQPEWPFIQTETQDKSPHAKTPSTQRG